MSTDCKRLLFTKERGRTLLPRSGPKIPWQVEHLGTVPFGTGIGTSVRLALTHLLLLPSSNSKWGLSIPSLHFSFSQRTWGQKSQLFLAQMCLSLYLHPQAAEGKMPGKLFVQSFYWCGPDGAGFWELFWTAGLGHLSLVLRSHVGTVPHIAICIWIPQDPHGISRKGVRVVITSEKSEESGGEKTTSF